MYPNLSPPVPWQRIILILLALARYLWAERVSLEQARELNEAAVQYQEHGRYEEALTAYSQAIRMSDQAGAPAPMRLRLRLNLAALHIEMGHRANAKRAVEEAEPLVSQCPRKSAETGAYHNAAGTLYLHDGNLAAALRSYSSALGILEGPGAKADELASVLQNIASVRIRQGDHAPAKENLLRALAILDSSPEGNIAQLIRGLASLSTLEYLAKDYRAADRAILRGLELTEEQFGGSNVLVGDLLRNRCLILDRLKRKSESRACRARAEKLSPSRPAAQSPVVDFLEFRASRGRSAVYTK